MDERGATRRRLIEQRIIHDEDHRANHARLNGLYGRVADDQNQFIRRHCLGRRVLDVGAGYGNLTRALRAGGLDAVGIEIDEEKIRKAREWSGVELEFDDIHQLTVADRRFDTVVFREVVNHLRLGEALAQAARLDARRVLIFQHNLVLPLRLAHRLFRHREHAGYSPADMTAALGRAGFSSIRTIYRDTLAFPLSGGYIGRSLVPAWCWLHDLLLGLDRAATAGLTGLGLGRWTCFRLLIAADREC